MNIQEVLREIVKKQHSVAVFKDIIEYLEEYLPTDTDPDPEERLTVDGSCLEATVTYEAIESVIETLSGILNEQQKELDKLNATETKPNGKSRKQPAAKKRTAKRKPPTKSAGT
jgi:uncharacterized coiled-coil protein SlyX